MRVGRPLRGLDGGDAGDAEHVALVVLAPPDEAERLRPHFDPAFRQRPPGGFRPWPPRRPCAPRRRFGNGSARPPLYYRRGKGPRCVRPRRPGASCEERRAARAPAADHPSPPNPATLPGAEMEESVEISAKVPDGVSRTVRRIVEESCRTLRFRSHGFEEEQGPARAQVSPGRERMRSSRSGGARKHVGLPPGQVPVEELQPPPAGGGPRGRWRRRRRGSSGAPGSCRRRPDAGCRMAWARSASWRWFRSVACLSTRSTSRVSAAFLSIWASRSSSAHRMTSIWCEMK